MGAWVKTGFLKAVPSSRTAKATASTSNNSQQNVHDFDIVTTAT